MFAINFGVGDFFYVNTKRGGFCGVIHSIVDDIEEKTFSTICIDNNTVKERFISLTHLDNFARKLTQQEIDMFRRKCEEIRIKDEICKKIEALDKPLKLLQIKLILDQE